MELEDSGQLLGGLVPTNTRAYFGFIASKGGLFMRVKFVSNLFDDSLVPFARTVDFRRKITEMDCGKIEMDSAESAKPCCFKSSSVETVVVVRESKSVDDSEKARIEKLLEQYGWTMDSRLGVVDSMSKVMSYVRTGSTENEMYYANRFRDVRTELRRSMPNAPRPLKEELCAIAFNCNILVALPLPELNQVDTFLLEKPAGVLPSWLHMPELSTTLTIASFPASDKESSLYAILHALPNVAEKTFRQPQLVRVFPGFRAFPSKRKSALKLDVAILDAVTVEASKNKVKKEKIRSKKPKMPSLEIAIAS